MNNINNSKHTQIIADDWNKGSDKYYARIYSGGELDEIIANPIWAFPDSVRIMLREAYGEAVDLRGKRVLVPSSGDNGAVFAFHLLGAKVRSADISERQLHNARRIAEENGWDISFIQADSMKLEGIDDGAYDLVYTSNGVHVWINDLAAMYSSFHRVLKKGGRYIMFETHPFIRPFDGEAADEGRFVVKKLYEELGPFGEVPTMAWRIMDIINALAGSGFAVRHMEEFHSQRDTFDCWWYSTTEEAIADDFAKFDIKRNPWVALPQWIGLSAVKEEKQ